ASGRDINPDVLGYIFEQYINDRAQMGAYYTKEDITEYIGRNTIIPYLLEATEKQYPEAFAPHAEFWSFIRSNGQDFIYDAVKKGVNEAIPEEIARGLDPNTPDLLEQRQRWNNPTPSNLGLPTEIWRETIARFQRYQEIVDKLQGGGLTSFNDFITYNLNTPRIAYDFLNTTDDRRFIEVFYGELLRVTILDPTCGSGAFLFAALNLLEPLYEVCISRMEEFNAQDPNAFKEQLAEIKNYCCPVKLPRA
ncbi:MAG: SAM-dependent methyltransferase, partial [Prevotella sp.]|nr:SAM-dependent methyltransferase [Prevotella sp.]